MFQLGKAPVPAVCDTCRHLLLAGLQTINAFVQMHAVVKGVMWGVLPNKGVPHSTNFASTHAHKWDLQYNKTSYRVLRKDDLPYNKLLCNRRDAPNDTGGRKGGSRTAQLGRGHSHQLPL